VSATPLHLALALLAGGCCALFGPATHHETTTLELGCAQVATCDGATGVVVAVRVVCRYEVVAPCR